MTKLVFNLKIIILVAVTIIIVVLFASVVAIEIKYTSYLIVYNNIAILYTIRFRIILI